MAKRWKMKGRKKAKFGKISWFYSYDVTYDESDCIITFRPKVQLKFPDGFGQGMKDAFVTAWSTAVGNAFNNKWKLTPVDPSNCRECADGIKINVRVKFVTDWTWTDDQEVTIGQGSERSSMRKWNIGDPDFGRTGGSPGVVHEVCHMLGMGDEYVDEENYPGKTEADLPADAKDGIMNDLTKPVLDRHMENIALYHGRYLPCPTYKLERQ